MSEENKSNKVIHKDDASFQDDENGEHLAPHMSEENPYDVKVFLEDITDNVTGLIAGMDSELEEDPNGSFLGSDLGKQTRSVLYTWLDTLLNDEALDTQTTFAEILLSLATTQAQIDLETQGGKKQ